MFFLFVYINTIQYCFIWMHDSKGNEKKKKNFQDKGSVYILLFFTLFRLVPACRWSLSIALNHLRRVVWDAFSYFNFAIIIII